MRSVMNWSRFRRLDTRADQKGTAHRRLSQQWRRSFLRTAAGLTVLVTAAPLAVSTSSNPVSVSVSVSLPEQAGRIAVRQASTGPEFFDAATGARFVPRGNNYIRLNSLVDPWGGTSFNHSLFVSKFFDEARTRRALRAMADDGYNIVRVFTTEISAGSRAGGVEPSYIANLARFIDLAWQHRIRVLVTFWNLPREGGYQLDHAFPTHVEGINATYLYQPLIDAKKRFLRDFISALKPMVPPEAVFGWEVENEVTFFETQKPFSQRSGLFAGADGHTYDLASETERNTLADNGLVHWANELTRAVKDADPAGLVTASFYSPLAVSGDDPRMIRTSHVMRDADNGGSLLDFIDIHMYPDSQRMSREMASFGIPKSGKPIIIGEMGISFPIVSRRSKTAEAAARSLRALQTLSCQEEFRVQGWITYTWDTLETQTGARDFYTAVADGNGVIARALAPRYQKDPCAWSAAENASIAPVTHD